MWLDQNTRIDVVYSPDDEAACGRGYYASKFEMAESRSLVSSRLYRTEEAVMKAIKENRIRWIK